MWPFRASNKEKIEVHQRKSVAIRMEAIGGQGANSAGKILAEAAVLGMGFSGNHFSSFGSEKRGSLVRSYARYNLEGRPVRSAAPIEEPDLLVLFHDSLLRTNVETLNGLGAGTDFVVNTQERPERLRLPENLKPRQVAAIDASAIQYKLGCGINAIMLGALSHFCSEVPSEKIRQALERFFAHVPESRRRANERGFEAGFREVQIAHRVDAEDSPNANRTLPVSQPLPKMGWQNAPIGGAIVTPGNTVLKDHRVSRTGTAPRFYPDICYHCGYCDMVCPDYCMVWNLDDRHSPKLLGIDYQYCKGCQKCVEVCPVSALEVVPESSIPEDEMKQKMFYKK